MLNRRQFIAASAAALTAVPNIALEATMENDEDSYRFDLAGIAKAFPDPAQIPPLLKSFGAWLSAQPWPAVGSYALEKAWADPEFAGGEYFYKDFAMFIWLPTGSVAGYWLGGNKPVSEAPIVLFGSEGERQVLAPDLESLLARIALNDFPTKGAAADFLGEEDDGYSDGNATVREEMQAFLRHETGIDDLAALAAKCHPEPVEFGNWVTRIENDRRTELAKDPDIKAIREILAGYRPVKAASWASTVITLYFVEGVVLQHGPKPLPEAAEIKPHLAVLRDRAAGKIPGLGLWHYANLFIYADFIEFRPVYMDEPKFLTAKPSADAYRSDQARMPTEIRRIPDWLFAILNS